MLFGEWDWDKALAVAREESLEEGIEKVLALWKSGVSLAKAEQKLGLSKTSKKKHRK